jgi:hypothetical protein
MRGWFSAMRQYKIYIQLENIKTQFILFMYRHQQWRPDCVLSSSFCTHNLPDYNNFRQPRFIKVSLGVLDSVSNCVINYIRFDRQLDSKIMDAMDICPCPPLIYFSWCHLSVKLSPSLQNPDWILSTKVSPHLHHSRIWYCRQPNTTRTHANPCSKHIYYLSSGQKFLWVNACLGKGHSKQMSFRANVFIGKCLSGQMSLWANVFLVKCLSEQMSSGQMSFWANVFLGKRPSGQMSFWANVTSISKGM